MDADDSYRLKPIPRKDVQGKRWASSEIAELLKAKGKDFDSHITPEDEDAYYEKL